MEENKNIDTVETKTILDNADNSVIEIALPDTVKKLKIDGKIYMFNTDSIELLREIERIGEQVRDIDSSDAKEEEKLVSILEKSKHGIDLALGSGTFVELFGDNMDSYLRPLYLLSQLVSICRQVTKDVVDIQDSSDRAKGRE